MNQDLNAGAHAGVLNALILCLRSAWDQAGRIELRRRLADQALDWPAFLEEARAGGVLPLLYDRLHGEPLLPAAVAQVLRQAYEETALRNALLLVELEALLAHLAGRQIPLILLKGAAMGELIYGNPALRPMVDLDLLVAGEQASAALGVLAERGYHPLHPEPHPGDALAFESQMAWRRAGAISVTVEIHWHLLDSPYYQEQLALDWFWATVRPLQVGATPAWGLGPEANLLYLCAHLALHHQGKGLLWLNDLAQSIVHDGSHLDWNLLLDQAVALELLLPLQTFLPALATQWCAPIPGAFLSRLAASQPSPAERRVFRASNAAHRPVVRRFYDDLAGMGSWRRRLRYALGNLFPAPSYMRQRYAIGRPSLLPLFYLYRWWLGLRSLGPGRLLDRGDLSNSGDL